MAKQVYTDLEAPFNFGKSMDFCEAFTQLRYGHVVKREQWEPGVYLKYYVVPKGDDTVEKGIYKVWPENRVLWQPSQSDLIAEDWLIVH